MQASLRKGTHVTRVVSARQMAPARCRFPDAQTVQGRPHAPPRPFSFIDCATTGLSRADWYTGLTRASSSAVSDSRKARLLCSSAPALTSAGESRMSAKKRVSLDTTADRTQ